MKILKNIFTILIVLVIFFSGVIYASNFNKTIEVAYLPLKYYFDGIQKEPPEGQSGFIYNGTTYVPLRFVSETLGKDVGWDGKNYSIYIGEQPRGEVTYLSDMKTLTSKKYKYEFTNDFITNMGDRFTNAYTLVGSWGYPGYISNEYILDGKYKKFKALLAPGEGYSEYEKVDNLGNLILYGDGKIIYESGPIDSDLLEPIVVDVDISGVLKLELTFETSRGKPGDSFYRYYNRTIGLIEAKFIN